MATRVARARRVVHHLPAVWSLGRDGVLEPYRADAAARSAELLEVADLQEYEARVCAVDITELSTGELARRCRRAAAVTDRTAIADVVARARARRSVRCGPIPTCRG